MKKNLFLVFILFTALYACGVKSAQKSDATPAEFASGKAIYMDACSKCHPAFDVKSKSVERWNQVLAPMIHEQAKLSAADGKLVEAYVWYELGVKG